jgi:hypothetical protein
VRCNLDYQFAPKAMHQLPTIHPEAPAAPVLGPCLAFDLFWQGRRKASPLWPERQEVCKLNAESTPVLPRTSALSPIEFPFNFSVPWLCEH